MIVKESRIKSWRKRHSGKILYKTHVQSQLILSRFYSLIHHMSIISGKTILIDGLINDKYDKLRYSPLDLLPL